MIRFSIFILIFCILSTIGSAQENMFIKKIFFIGDSLTRHAPKADLGWTGNYGMAASAEEKDYVHLVVAKITANQKNAPEFACDAVGGGTIAGQLANTTQIQNASADVVVIQLGENDKEITEAAFEKPYENIVLVVKKSMPKTRIFCFSVWGSSDKDGMIKKVCERQGCVFVDITAAWKDPACFALAEKRFTHAGVSWHPGDKGMQFYADALYQAILASSKIVAELAPQITEKTFKAKLDGTTQAYVEILPTSITNNDPVDVLIALHGHGSDRWQFVKDQRGECLGARNFATSHNMLYVSPDYRAKTSWMGPAAEADMVQLISEIKASRKIHRVFLMGGSMGGTSALIFTALHPELVAGVCALNGTANMLEYEGFQEFICVSYGGDKVKKSDEFKKRSPELSPEKFKMPVACTVGGKDAVVPPSSVRRLMGQLEKTNKKNILLIDRPEVGHETNYEDTVAVLEFMLKCANTQAK